ncbi:MAG: histidine phosphatase family protein [Chloroflexota bacterium]
MTTLFLIRHGQTQWNLEGKYTGQSDIPLNSNGRLQALRAAMEFRNNPPDAIYSSDLIRAYETAEIVANGCGFLARIEQDQRLREINQGVWEGMHFDDIKAKFSAEFEAREANPLEVAAPEGETVGQVQDRVLSAISDICASNPPGSRIAIVAHGLALAIIRAWYMEVPVQDVWSLIPPNAKVLEVQVSPDLDSFRLKAGSTNTL